MYVPREIYLVRIDNWFDWKWRGFMGKTLGKLGVWGFGRLVIPPFHPNRVRSQRLLRYLEVDGSYAEESESNPLHLRIPSQQNLARKVTALPPSTVLAWLGGDSEKTGRGSVMIYAAKPLPEHGLEEGVWSAWYVSFVRVEDAWQVRRSAGLSRPEIRAMLAKGAGTRTRSA